METTNRTWNKEELKVYILLLCANADSVKTDDEMQHIRSRVNAEVFERMQEEIAADSEDHGLAKIEQHVSAHEYSQRELNELHREMRAVFFSDKNFSLMERQLDRILKNILY